MGIFGEKRVVAEITLRPDGTFTVELRGRESGDVEALGLLAVGYLVKLAWDTARESAMTAEALRRVAAHVAEAALDSALLENALVYQSWMAGPQEERVRGAKARYKVRLLRDGSVNTGIPFRNLAYLHALSVVMVADAAWTRMDPTDRERLRKTFRAAHGLLSEGSEIDPSLSGLRRMASGAREAWLANDVS